MTHPFAQDMAETGVHFALRPNAGFNWFQVMGERASGTNLVRKLIELNVGITHTTGLGWKHGFPHMVAVPNDTVVVAAVRNAEDWALSMHKRPWHLAPEAQSRGFSDFIRAPWEGIVDGVGHFAELHADQIPGCKGRALQMDRHPITGLPFDNLFALRRAKLAALTGLLNRNCSVVLMQMETIVSEPQAFMQLFRAATSTQPRQENWRAPKRRLGNNFKRAVAAQTPSAMSEADRAFMIGELDLDLEAALGYRYN